MSASFPPSGTSYSSEFGDTPSSDADATAMSDYPYTDEGAEPSDATAGDADARRLPDEHSVEWSTIGAFAAGIAFGALLGAGAAMLYAPLSGEDARRALRRRARGLGLRAADQWTDLGDALRHATRARKVRFRRSVERQRWAAADAIDPSV